ncbi:MAG TPA: protease modulator HflC [Thermotogota bacterium]|mgnify:CR=1 FL=1|nr:protease modulator HflC [Thermotogota bacterium]
MKKVVWTLVVFILFFIVFALFTYQVDQAEVAVRTRFGKILTVNTEPGLYFKAPFIDTILTRDKRIQIYDIPPESILTTDQKRLEVDTYVLWRISEPQQFIETMKTITSALTRLDDVVYSTLRDKFAELYIGDIISERRRRTLQTITDTAEKTMNQYGIDILDVDVKRTDLPSANAQAVFDRMKSERNKEASLIRAEGERQAQDTRARAQKDADILIAEANKTAEVLRGEGDAQALEIYANAFSQDPDFYRFWRIMTAYKNSMKNGTSIVMGKDMEYLNEFYGGFTSLEIKQTKETQ